MEHATRRRVERRRDVARNHCQGLVTLFSRVGFGHGVQQGLCVRVGGLLEQFVLGAQLHHGAQVHHHHPVADVLDHRQIMRNEHQRQVHLALQLPQQLNDLGLDGHIKCRQGLVAQNHFGPQDDGAGNADALGLTS